MKDSRNLNMSIYIYKYIYLLCIESLSTPTATLHLILIFNIDFVIKFFIAIFFTRSMKNLILV